MTDFGKNTHCSRCGSKFDRLSWPRKCVRCELEVFQNPLPVAIAMVPVDSGILVVRRAIEPDIGFLALPGGYINLGESWEEAVSRELSEETGICFSPDDVSLFDVRLSRNKTHLLIFGAFKGITGDLLPEWQPNEECSERLIVSPDEIYWATHAETAKKFLSTRRP